MKPNQNVARASKHAEIAKKVYNDYINEMLNNGVPGIEWTEVDKLAKIANEADRNLLQAKHDALNECTCEPDGDACIVCVNSNRQRHGDTIPYGG